MFLSWKCFFLIKFSYTPSIVCCLSLLLHIVAAGFHTQVCETCQQFGSRQRASLCLTSLGFWYFLLQRFDAVIEALEKGQAVDLSGLPPSPGQGEERLYNMFFYFSKQANITSNFISFTNRSYRVIYRRNKRRKYKRLRRTRRHK